MGKEISIELKRNDQGQFVKIIERQGEERTPRGRIIFSSEKSSEFKSILKELMEEYARLPPEEDTTDSKTLETYAYSCRL